VARGSVARRELPGGVTPAEILALEDLGRRRGGVVYLGGSVVEGHGNPWSDVDVFVVGNLPPVGPDVKPGDVNTVSVHFYKGVRFDFEYWAPERVRDLARRLRSIRLGITRSLTRTTFSYIEECFLHRLRTGRPLRDARGFRKWQSRFNFRKFALYQAQETVRHVDAMLEDACGMLEAGHVEAAVFTAREMVGEAVDAYCHFRGETDPVKKWRLVHVARLPADDEHQVELRETYWQLQFPPLSCVRDGARARAYVEQCVRFTNRVVSWIQ
jgi:predicted nucleotidyltransferase